MRLLSVVVAVIAAAMGARAAPSPGPLPPSQDAFYTPPKGYQHAKPGTVLRSRRTPNPPALLFLNFNLAASYQLLYRTSNSSGYPMATVTTVFIPHGANFSQLLSYQTFEDSACPDCAPSYTLQSHSQGFKQLENVIMQIPLNKGWVVATPDYEGPNAAFTAGFVSGYGTLDGIRAVLNSQHITGVERNATVCMMGYSGGSLASGWASQVQPDYAPELKIAGAAIGGLTPNITSVALSVNKGQHVDLVAAGLMGLASEYPSFNLSLQYELKPESANDFLDTKRQCTANDDLKGADIFSYFTRGKDVLNVPPIRDTLDQNTQGKLTPQMPMFWYHSKHDEVAPVEEVDKLYDTFCSTGAIIEYTRDLTGNHESMAIGGLPAAINWLDDRFSGKPPPSRCVKSTVLSSLFNFRSIFTFGEEITDILLGFIGRPIGV